MSQLENQESGDRAIVSRPEAKSLQTADAQAARAAGASQVEAAQALNPNRHNGSAGGDRHDSIQIVAVEEDGKQKIIAQRPRDMGQESAKEITHEYIRDKAKTGDVYAQTFAKDLDMAEKLAAGPERDKAIAYTLWKAECMFNPGKQKEAPETASNNRMDTGAFIALEAEKNPVAEPVAKFHQWVKEQPPGPEQEAFKQLVRQQAAELSPEMRANMEQLARQRAMSDQSGLDAGGTHMAISPEMLQGRVTVSDEPPLANTPEGWLNVGQKIAALPLLQQVEVIGSGLRAGIEQYQQDERERAWGRLIGTVEGVGQVAVNLAKVADFGAALVLGDSERAGQMGAEFGNAVGETIVSGVQIFRAGDEYFQSVGYSGNYDKPFADLLVVANTLNERWSQLPPLEQERIKYRFFTEMTADGLIGLGGAKAIGKAKTFTEVLDTASQEVAKHGKQAVDASKKAARTLANTVDDLLQPDFVTPDGQRIKLGRLNQPHADKPDTGMLMSKADDLSGSKPEHLRPGKGREIEPVDEREIVNPIDRAAPAEQKVAQLMALSEKNKPLVEKFLKTIDTKFGTKSEMSFKERQDILDKAKRPSIKENRPWFDVEHVRDSFRFKTPVHDMKDLPNIVKHLRDSGFEVVKLDLDKLINPKGRGWRMAAIDLKAPNGQILEYQILPTEMNEAGKIEHQMYKQWRSKDVSKLSPGDLNQKREVDAAAADLYTDAWDSYLKRSGQTQDTIKEIIRQTYLVLEQ